MDRLNSAIGHFRRSYQEVPFALYSHSIVLKHHNIDPSREIFPQTTKNRIPDPFSAKAASPACQKDRASVARYGQPREKRSVRGEPAGYELGEEPHALRLACLPLREKPERSIHVQVGARHPHQ